jgi:flagellar hook-associated protein 3 FlgL
MRVTDRMLQNSLITNLTSASERLYAAETQVLTQKRVNTPSDNPVDALSAMKIQTRLSEIEQYQRDISRAKSTLNGAETAVDELSDIFTRLNTLTVQGASDSYGENDKTSIAEEVNQLLEEVVNIANTRTESVYVFGGSNNDQQPYQVERNENGDIVKVTTVGTNGDLNTLIGENITIKTNVNGEDLFEKGTNLFETIIKVRDDLLADSTDDLSDDLNSINNASEQILEIQATVGARLNRVNSADSRAENDVISFTELLSDAVDIDASEAIMNYQMELLTLQASLQAGARLLQPKLIDFLS